MHPTAARALLLTVCVACVALAMPVTGADPGVTAGETTTTATTTEGSGGSPAAELVARYETENGSVEETVLTPDGIESVGTVETDPETGTAYVPVTLTPEAAERFSERLVAAGFGDGATCRYEERPDAPGDCLLTVVDGEVLYGAGVGPVLGESFRTGEFAEDPRFRLVAANESQARELRAALVGDATTAPEAGTEPTSEESSTTAATDTDEESGDGTPGPGVLGALAAIAVGLAVVGARRGCR